MTEQADAVAIADAKRTLRRAVRLRREARAADRRQHDDEQRFARLVDLLAERPVRRLAAYLSAGTEPDSLRLVAWSVAHDIEVLLPVLTDGPASWLPEPAWAAYAGPDALREGRSRILEPTGPRWPTTRWPAWSCWSCPAWRPMPPGTDWDAAVAGTTARVPPTPTWRPGCC